MKKRILSIIALVAICVSTFSIQRVAAEEVTAQLISAKSDVIELYSYEDLAKLSSNPTGTFVLKCDIDFTGKEWKPVDFSGIFDGEGHAFLNVNVKDITTTTSVTYDGNLKTYDTYFAGIFGSLKNASVKNLNVLGLKVDIDTDKDCMIGGIAGFMEGSTVENCNVEGELDLRVAARMFGVAGLVGFGNGSLKNCSADVTLVCIDKDAVNKDEQFMGGAYCAGYIDTEGCKIDIKGYDSDHGYVHDGGLIGMYALYPAGTNYAGKINNNTVNGFITFFEDNADRRAYCSGMIGEVLNWTYEYVGNFEDFERDERTDYSVDLLPHTCSNPTYKTTVKASSCTEYGYTLNECSACSEYSFKSNYKPKAHTLSDAVVVEAATTEREGLQKAACSKCNALVFEKTAKLEQVAQSVDNKANDAGDNKADEANGGNGIVKILVIIGLVALLLMFLYCAVTIYKNKQRAKRRRKRNRNRR